MPLWLVRPSLFCRPKQRRRLTAPTSSNEIEVAAFFAKGEQADSYYGIMSIPHDRPAAEALRLTVAPAERAPSDEALCWLGVALLEPLIELHWRALGDAVDRALKQSPSLRKAFSCVWLSGVPAEIENRWEELIRPDEDVGRQPGE